jgi:hypothetical protein
VRLLVDLRPPQNAQLPTKSGVTPDLTRATRVLPGARLNPVAGFRN